MDVIFIMCDIKFPNFRVSQNHLEGFLKHGLLKLSPRGSDSVPLGWPPMALKIYIADKILGHDAASPGTIL